MYGDSGRIHRENREMMKEVKNNASYLYSGKSGPNLAGCSHCMRNIRQLPNDGALSGIGRCIPVFRICGMEKREGRQSNLVKCQEENKKDFLEEG